ncbi:trehalose operon repressor [Bacillus massiliigorillae]|uniref:trehalose operon repressor n=1 Tax=Bacillus massiliigorillae TaxID=1243664 RepID=UPI001E28B7F0|nr:trehalose operon repressor [Bacillus massiliigorillae]
MMDKKYVNIYNDLVDKIENEVYVADDKLPSEKSLMDYYNVSRDTIRKSLNKLEQNGYIAKVNGKGSFVLDIQKFDFPVSKVVSFKELTDQLGDTVTTEVKVLDCSIPSKNIAKKLGLESNEKVWTIIRKRIIDGQKVILDKDYIPEKFVGQLTEEICQDSLYSYIEGELEYKISYARKEITVQMANDEDKMSLDMKEFDMIVVIKSYTYLDDTSLFQYTESRHRPDKFKFVDFARR